MSRIVVCTQVVLNSNYHKIYCEVDKHTLRSAIYALRVELSRSHRKERENIRIHMVDSSNNNPTPTRVRIRVGEAV